MIFLHRQSHTAAPDHGIAMYRQRDVMPRAAACGFAVEEYPHQPISGSFAYLFEDVPEMPHDATTTAALDALADAMVEARSGTNENTGIPPVYTYLGQFIDHDIIAPTDLETGVSLIDVPQVDPLSRERARQGLGNLRAGALNLDSLYGGGPLQGDFAHRLADVLRSPHDRAKLWTGTLFNSGLSHVSEPSAPGTDHACDVLRAGQIIGQPDSPFSEAEIRALPAPLRSLFINPDGTLRVQRAILGDMRNDENLIISQLHLAFVCFHNRAVEAAEDFGGLVEDRDELFRSACRKLRWIYQWIVVNDYLPVVCDPSVVRQTLAAGAPLYRNFFATHLPARPGLMPLPLEFSAAAFRFGHSMVRASYDWNRFFGRGMAGEKNLQPEAQLEQLYAYTGSAETPMPLPNLGSTSGLPSHWSVEWGRLALPVTKAMPDRSARRIDTHLALPLADLANEAIGSEGMLRNLARRNLRRGHRLNLPAAQDCIAAINRRTGANITPLSEDQLTSGVTGNAITRGGFVGRTPLWFYVLKEAEVTACGQHLGPLGSRLLAETLIGLIVSDPRSYWHQPGSADGHWHPRDSVMPAGEPVESIAALLRAARLL